MSYRVTNTMMQQIQLSDMHRNMNSMLKAQEQISTQRKYIRPSEDPVAITRAMGIDTALAENEQYQANLSDAIAWLKFSDRSLGNITDIFQRMRELAIQAGDGALKGVDTKAIAKELSELREELRQAANASMEKRFLFGGLKTGTPPFSIGPDGEVLYNGNDYNMFWEFERLQTGQVSTTGRDVFPKDEQQNLLRGIELPLDFKWKGRDEILEFKVGWRTVKVRIPERWNDEILDDKADPADYNRFRDPGERLEGYSLQEIADRINSSMEMGDSGRLVNCRVITDNVRNVQRLEIKSHTGEPVRLTGWPETDPVNLSQGMHGAAYGPLGRTASADGQIKIRFTDKVYTMDIKKGENLAEVAAKLRKIDNGRLWAAHKTDKPVSPSAEWLDLVSRKPGDTFTLETTGGAASLFAPQSLFLNSSESEGKQKITSTGFALSTPFAAVSTGQITLNIAGKTYEIPVTVGNSVADIAGAVNALGVGVAASTGSDGELVLSASEAFNLTASGGAVPLFGSGASLPPASAVSTHKLPANFALNGEGALAIRYAGKSYWLDLAGASTLEDVAAAVNAFSGSLPGGANLKADLIKGVDSTGTPAQWLEISASGDLEISGYGSGADVVGRYFTGSQVVHKNTDHSHIDFARYMGMETALKSTELALDRKWDSTQPGQAVHMKFVSGNRRAEIFINDDANLTLEEMAQRIRGVCGDWLDVVLETDGADGTSAHDPLGNSGKNREDATQRLVIRSKDGAPVAVYDGPGKKTTLGTVAAGSYASLLGMNTALIGNSANPGGAVVYPSDGAGAFDENMPALLDVQVGDRTYRVKVCANRCPDAASVAKAIAAQVNEQYGGPLLSVDDLNIDPANPDPAKFALFSTTGEPIRVIDRPFGDPRFSEYTGGVAMQLGIQSGITSAPGILDTQTAVADGVIRIRTPGQTVDVPILVGERLQDIAGRIREYTGSWLDVSFCDTTLENPGGGVRLSLAAKDGSAVSLYDIRGDNAGAFGLDTGMVGSADLQAWQPVAGDRITLAGNGVEHTIDLWDSQTPGGRPTVWNVEELADMINTRFQGADLRAEVVTTKDAAGTITRKQLAIWSPKGYTVTADTSNMAVPPGFAFPTSPVRGGSGPFNQQTTVRTAPNQKEIDFFGVMDNLVSAVAAEDRDGISDSLLGKMDRWFGTLLKTRAQVGALINRYDTGTSRTVANNMDLTELNDEIIGVDLAEASMNYQMMAAVYQASLAMMARVIQPSLLEFLR